MNKIVKQKLPLIITGILVLMVLGCKDAVQIRQQLIAGKEYKLWRKVKDTSESKGKSYYLYYFDTKGNWKIFIKYPDFRKIVRPEVDDIILLEKWHLVDPGNVNVGGRRYKIETLNDTSFVYKDTSINREIKLFYKNDVLPNDSLKN